MFHSSSRQWLVTSVLSQSADPFVAYLQQHQFHPGTVKAYLHCIGHFARWLTEQRIPLGSIDEVLIERFVTEHLRGCKCPAPCQRAEVGMRAAWAHLVRVRRANHCIAGPRLGPPAIHNEIERFDAHLDSVGGLAPATRISRRMWVREFLLARFGDGPVSVGRLKPGDIADFLRTHCDGYRPGTVRVLGCSLRSYLRFRALHGGDPVEPLVAALGLDDVNWREGTLRIVGGKSRRSDVLPLPAPTGRAIVEYLKEARPPSASRALFVRHRAPLDVPIDAEFVRGAVRRAFARCGLADRYSGTHVLRHTAAQHALRGGASLKQVADVLRHRSLDTTTIYTKVDLPRLAAVAAPWPEEQS